MEIMVNILVYTFAIFGLVVFIKELAHLYIYKRSLCNLVLLVDEGEQNIEGLLRQVLRLSRWSGLIGYIYVLLKEKDENSLVIAQTFGEKNNVNIIEKDELMKMLEEV